MPGSAPTYKRECNARRTQTSGIRRSRGDVAVASSRRHPIGHLGLLSCYTGHRIFSALSITGLVIRRWIDAAFPGHSADATVRTDVEAAVVFGQQPGNAPLTSGRRDLLQSSRGDHDHERIRGAVSVPSAITVSNLRGGPGIQSGRKAESTRMGCCCFSRCNDDNISGRVASLHSC